MTFDTVTLIVTAAKFPCYMIFTKEAGTVRDRYNRNVTNGYIDKEKVSFMLKEPLVTIDCTPYWKLIRIVNIGLN